MRRDYIALNYKPKSSEVIAEYYMEPEKDHKFEEVATAVAGESSIDTWTDIKTLSPALAKKLKPHVYNLDKRKKIIKVAYHKELFELGSVAQLLSSIAGNIFSMKMVANLRLLDVKFPKEMVKWYKGPKFGIKGIRRILKSGNRPLLGTIVKPKMGLSSREHAQVAFESWVGGLDLVKDDENLTDQKFNNFRERVRKTLEMRNRAEILCRCKKIYMPNITAPTVQEMIKRAEYVKEKGGEYIMVDVVTSGWTALQSLRVANEKLKLVLHGHRCMHSAMTRNPKHGISMMVVAKLVRLIGLDQLHTGTIVGKMEGGSKEVLDIDFEMEHELVKEDNFHNVLTQKWQHLRRLMPVASGGVQPLMIPEMYKYFGKDIIIQLGGGVHAHPQGTRAGAKAAAQALVAALRYIPLKQHAKSNPELALAIKKWG